MKTQRRSLVTTTVLILVAAAAVAVAFFGVEERDKASERKKEAEARLYTFSPEKVTALSVEAKGTKTRLARADDGWRIEEPVKVAADRQTVRALVEEIARLKRKASVTRAPDAAGLQNYGLDLPRTRVVLTLEDGKSEKLEIGKENAFDSTLFVRTTGGTVELVQGGIQWSAELGTFDLRDKTVLRFDRSKVVTIRFRHGTTVFEARVQGASKRLDTLVSSLGSLSATAFSDDTGRELARHGLDRPEREVALLSAEGKELERLLVSAARGGKVYAKAGSSPAIVEIEPSQAAELPRTAKDLEDPPAEPPPPPRPDPAPLPAPPKK